MKVSASEVSESLENSESGIEAIDSWLGGRSIASGEFVRALEKWSKGMCIRQLRISS